MAAVTILVTHFIKTRSVTRFVMGYVMEGITLERLCCSARKFTLLKNTILPIFMFN